MIKLTMSSQRLKEVYDVAEREQRTLLGVIYNDYIIPQFSIKDTLDPRKVYASRDLILEMIRLDKELYSEGVDDIYLQYAPSTILRLPKNEIVVLQRGEVI